MNESVEWRQKRGFGCSRRGRGLALLGLILALLVSCSGRWRPNTPVEVPLRAETTEFARVVAALRASGYAVSEQDPSAGYVRVAAKSVSSKVVNGVRIPDPGSWFAIQTHPNKLVLSAGGYLVRDQDTVRRNFLDEELSHLAEQLRRELGR